METKDFYYLGGTKTERKLDKSDGRTTMVRIKREQSVFEFSPHNTPVAHASPGDTIVFETFD